MLPGSYQQYRIKWLEILLFLIFWIYKKYRVLKLIGALITILLIFMYANYTYSDDAHYDGSYAFNLWSEMDFGVYSIARLILLYYFGLKFEPYPWNKWPTYFNSEYYKNKMRSCSVRLQIYLFTYTAIMTVHLIYETKIDAPNDSWKRRILDSGLASAYTIYLPIMVSQCVLSFILLKYELFLYYIQSTMDMNSRQHPIDVDTNDIFVLYRDMFNSFHVSYNKIWQSVLLCELLAMLYVIWDAIARIEGYYDHDHDLDNVQVEWLWLSCATEAYHILPFIEYVYSSARLNNQYKEWKRFYWKFIMQRVENRNNGYQATINNLGANNSDFDDMALEIVFLEYMKENKFNVYLSGIKVTVSNSIKCIVLYAMTRLISISINDYLF